MTNLRFLVDFKARSASNVSDFSFSPEHTETDDDNQKEITQKSVTQLIDAYNAATNTTSSSPISPKSSPSGKSKHRTNPSRDIRFTYLREVEGKGDDGGLHHVEKNDGSKKHERHVSFPQFSNDELDSNLSPRGRKDSTFGIHIIPGTL